MLQPAAFMNHHNTDAFQTAFPLGMSCSARGQILTPFFILQEHFGGPVQALWWARPASEMDCALLSLQSKSAGVKSKGELRREASETQQHPALGSYIPRSGRNWGLLNPRCILSKQNSKPLLENH